MKILLDTDKVEFLMQFNSVEVSRTNFYSHVGITGTSFAVFYRYHSNHFHSNCRYFTITLLIAGRVSCKFIVMSMVMIQFRFHPRNGLSRPFTTRAKDVISPGLNSSSGAPFDVNAGDDHFL